MYVSDGDIDIPINAVRKLKHITLIAFPYKDELEMAVICYIGGLFYLYKSRYSGIKINDLLQEINQLT